MTGCALTLTSCAGADQQGSAAHRMSVWVSGTTLGEDIGTLDRRQRPGPQGRAQRHRRRARGLRHHAQRRRDGQHQPALARPRRDRPADAGLRARGHRGEPSATTPARPTEALAQSERNGIKAEALYQEVAAAHPPHRRAPVSTTTTTDNSSGASSDERDPTRQTRTPPTPATTTSSTATAAGSCGRSPPASTSIGSRSRRRRQPHDGQPGGPGLPGAQAGRRGARARLGHGRPRRRPAAASPCRCSPAATATWCGASSSPSTTSSAPPTGPSSPCRANAVTEVGPDRPPVLAAAAGYLDCA